ncbi:hypothetical protein AB0N05_05585 [Nocardia sp. NPDC051030]|uniref:hypothetical protein n=1 Tax=Nocardia sp. NPDC051030 TaxID=3155162 RepID=UPI003441B1B5
MDPRSESPGESLSRVRMHEFGLPIPELQTTVLNRTCVFIARVDFCLPTLGVIGEFDGRSKYGRLLKPGDSTADAVYNEKLREDALRALGTQVVRWTWPDLTDFTAAANRWRTAITRATKAPPPQWRIR